MLRVFALLVVGLLSFAALPSASAGTDWPGFQRDALHTGIAADADIADELDLVWSHQLDGQLKGSPVVADGLVYVGTDAGHVYAIGANTGKIVWGPKLMAHPVLATPAYENNRLYVATSSLDGAKGELAVLNAKTGANITTKDLGSGSYAGAVIEDGKIFVGTDAGSLLAYETEGMSKLWDFPTAVTLKKSLLPKQENSCCLTSDVKAKPVKTVPISYKERVYFSAFNHLLFSVDSGGNPGAETTDLVWVENVHDIVYSSAGISSKYNMILVGSYDGELYSFDADPYQAPDSCHNSTRRNYHPVGNDCSKRVYWQYSTNSRIFSSPAIANDRAYVGDNDGTLHAVDLVSGRAMWTYKAKGGIYASPAVVNHTIVVGSYDGKLYLFKESEDGKTVNTPFTFTLGGKLHASPAIVNGIVYVGSDDGMLHALAEPGTVQKVAPDAPDIVVTGIRFDPDALVANQPAQAFVQFENIGGTDSSPALMRFYHGASLLGEAEVQVAVDQTKEHAFPINPTEGNMTFRAIFDEIGSLDELDEDNNVHARTVTVAAAEDGGGGKKKSTEEDTPGIGFVGALAALGAVAVSLTRRRRAA